MCKIIMGPCRILVSYEPWPAVFRCDNQTRYPPMCKVIFFYYQLLEDYNQKLISDLVGRSGLASSTRILASLWLFQTID